MQVIPKIVFDTLPRLSENSQKFTPSHAILWLSSKVYNSCGQYCAIQAQHFTPSTTELDLVFETALKPTTNIPRSDQRGH